MNVICCEKLLIWLANILDIIKNEITMPQNVDKLLVVIGINPDNERLSKPGITSMKKAVIAVKIYMKLPIFMLIGPVTLP